MIATPGVEDKVLTVLAEALEQGFAFRSQCLKPSMCDVVIGNGTDLDPVGSAIK